MSEKTRTVTVRIKTEGLDAVRELAALVRELRAAGINEADIPAAVVTTEKLSTALACPAPDYELVAATVDLDTTDEMPTLTPVSSNDRGLRLKTQGLSIDLESDLDGAPDVDVSIFAQVVIPEGVTAGDKIELAAYMAIPREHGDAITKLLGETFDS